MTEYIETDGTDDLESRVLDAITEGLPYVLVLCTQLEPDITIRCVTGGGIRNADTAKGLLSKAVKAFPE